MRVFWGEFSDSDAREYTDCMTDDVTDDVTDDGAAIRREAARLMATARTEKQRQSSRESAEKARAARSARARPCDCGHDQGERATHGATCPAYRRAAAKTARRKQAHEQASGE